MNREKILKLIAEAVNEELSSTAYENSDGINSEILGKEEFLVKVNEILYNAGISDELGECKVIH